MLDYQLQCSFFIKAYSMNVHFECWVLLTGFELEFWDEVTVSHQRAQILKRQFLNFALNDLLGISSLRRDIRNL